MCPGWWLDLWICSSARRALFSSKCPWLSSSVSQSLPDLLCMIPSNSLVSGGLSKSGARPLTLTADCDPHPSLFDQESISEHLQLGHFIPKGPPASGCEQPLHFPAPALPSLHKPKPVHKDWLLVASWCISRVWFSLILKMSLFLYLPAWNCFHMESLESPWNELMRDLNQTWIE